MLSKILSSVSLAFFALFLGSCTQNTKTTVQQNYKDSNTVFYRNSAGKALGGESSLTARNPSPAAMAAQAMSDSDATSQGTQESNHEYEANAESSYSRVANSQTSDTP